MAQLNRELSSERLVVDVAVSVRQETGALVAGKLALSTTHSQSVAHPVHLSKIQGYAGPSMCWRH